MSCIHIYIKNAKNVTNMKIHFVQEIIFQQSVHSFVKKTWIPTSSMFYKYSSSSVRDFIILYQKV